MKKNMKMLYLAALVLLVVGGLNWGAVGLLNLDLVAMFLGPMTTLTKGVYMLVGLAGVYVGLMEMMKRVK